MATWRGDGERALEEAIREPDLRKKVEKLEDAMVLHFRETEQVLKSLGVENFSELGLREIRGEGK